MSAFTLSSGRASEGRRTSSESGVERAPRHYLCVAFGKIRACRDSGGRC